MLVCFGSAIGETNIEIAIVSACSNAWDFRDALLGAAKQATANVLPAFRYQCMRKGAYQLEGMSDLKYLCLRSGRRQFEQPREFAMRHDTSAAGPGRRGRLRNPRHS